MEIFIGVAVGIIGMVFSELSGLKRTRLQAVQGESNKTYEKSLNANRSSSLRNLQRSRSGSIFSSGISKVFPDCKAELESNSSLKSIVQKAF